MKNFLLTLSLLCITEPLMAAHPVNPLSSSKSAPMMVKKIAAQVYAQSQSSAVPADQVIEDSQDVASAQAEETVAALEQWLNDLVAWIPNKINSGVNSLTNATTSTLNFAGRQWPTVCKAAAVAGFAYLAYDNYKKSKRGYAPRLSHDERINDIALTITVHRNGWRQPLTLTLQKAGGAADAFTDAKAFQSFMEQLNKDLTPAERLQLEHHEATVDGRPIAALAIPQPVLEHARIYTFTVEGRVSYDQLGTYTLCKETIIDTITHGGLQQPADLQAWLQLFWEKHIASRVASTWARLPHHLIPATSHPTYCVTVWKYPRARYISDEVCHIEKHSLPELKAALIDQLAELEVPGAARQYELQFTVNAGKNRFVSNPLVFALNPPTADQLVRTVRIPLPPRLVFVGEDEERRLAFEYRDRQPLTLPHWSLLPLYEPRRVAAAAVWQEVCQPFCGEVRDIPAAGITVEQAFGSFLLFGLGSYVLYRATRSAELPTNPA